MLKYLMFKKILPTQQIRAGSAQDRQDFAKSKCICLKIEKQEMFQ
jgi:hypothetical protein